MIQTWRLDGPRQTLALSSEKSRCPQIIYWGAPLPPQEDLVALAQANTLDVTGGMLDENPDLSLNPEAARSFPGQPGLIIRGADGTPLLPTFKLSSVKEGEHALHITCEDNQNQLTYVAEIALDQATHVISLTSTLRGTSFASALAGGPCSTRTASC